MRKSEIFDNFVKIAQENKMISPEASEKAKKKLENDPRWDSLDASTIEVLYGVKPDLPKDMQYSKNIIEDAHPNSVIVAPSYDKLNGLVENLNERQNIILNIVNKPNNGYLTQHKYAEHSLLMSLLKISNEANNEEFKKISNYCIDSICNSKIEKKAAIMLPIAIIAASIGALWAQQQLPMADQGYEKNYQNLINELNDLLTSSADWGVGVKYTEDFKKFVNDFKTKLQNFNTTYQRVKPIILELDRPKDANELKQLAEQPQTQTVIKAYEMLTNMFNKLKPYIEKVQENFKNESFKARQIQEKGLLIKMVDFTQILHGGKGLIADDIDDVARAIPPFLKSVEEIQNVLLKAKSIENSAKLDLMEAQQTDKKDVVQEFDDLAENLTLEE